MTAESYALEAKRTDQHSQDSSLAFVLLGLFGEVGSLLSEVKKKQRDTASRIGYAEAVAEEFGDVLWYLSTVADRTNLPLETLMRGVDLEHTALETGRDGSTTFASLQPAVLPRPGVPTSALESTLLRLAAETGRLVADHADDLLDDDDTLARRLTAIMSVLIRAANEAHVSLEVAALKNCRKIQGRWPSTRIQSPALDVSAEPEEQLPRTLTIEIFERKVNGRNYVFQRCNNLNIGDRLTDNAMEADDYRFHDVFHLAYASVLTWSPVIRSLLRRKRKSESRTDEVEDGARAKLIEEGVATLIFGQAKELELFADVERGKLSFDLLKQIRRFVAGYEVESAPPWLWEEAILQGYAAFRYLREHRRGRLHLDLNARQLSIEALP